MLTNFLFFSFLLFVSVILILVWLYDRRRNTIARQEAIKRELNQTYLESTLEIREHTILDTRHELHNNMGQLASLIKMNLNKLVLQEPDLAGGKMEETMEITQQLINEIKSLSLSLSAGNLSISGIDEAIEAEVERLNKSGRVQVNFKQEGSFPLSDKMRMVILFRLSQEIIQYRIKKGKAKYLSILLQGLENVLILSFNDDGCVMEEDDLHEYGEGLLPGLDKKAKLINARFYRGNTSLEKSSIHIEMPL